MLLKKSDSYIISKLLHQKVNSQLLGLLILKTDQDPNALKSRLRIPPFALVDQDAFDMFEGKLNPQNAFMQGKMKIKGNMQAAMKFTPDLFPKGNL